MSSATRHSEQVAQRLGAAPYPLVGGVEPQGNFAVIGIRGTATLAPLLPETASCGPDEEIVIVPRRILTGARRDIPRE